MDAMDGPTPGGRSGFSEAGPKCCTMERGGPSTVRVAEFGNCGEKADGLTGGNMPFATTPEAEGAGDRNCG